MPNTFHFLPFFSAMIYSSRQKKTNKNIISAGDFFYYCLPFYKEAFYSLRNTINLKLISFFFFYVKIIQRICSLLNVNK